MAATLAPPSEAEGVTGITGTSPESSSCSLKAGAIDEDDDDDGGGEAEAEADADADADAGANADLFAGISSSNTGCFSLRTRAMILSQASLLAASACFSHTTCRLATLKSNAESVVSSPPTRTPTP